MSSKGGGNTLITKDGTNKLAKVIGVLVGNGSATSLDLTETSGTISVYHATASGIALLPSSQYSLNNTRLSLSFAPQQGELILVTTEGKLLFADLYVFSNLAKAEQRSAVDEFYIHADTNRLINISISAESYPAPPDAPAIQFSFSLTNSNFTPTLTIAELALGQSVKVYVRATAPANLRIGSFINYSIIVDAQEVPG
ncbi:MAG: hypothetical protein QXE80_03490 [Pyrobaculum sp.]